MFGLFDLGIIQKNGEVKDTKLVGLPLCSSEQWYVAV